MWWNLGTWSNLHFILNKGKEKWELKKQSIWNQKSVVWVLCCMALSKSSSYSGLHFSFSQNKDQKLVDNIHLLVQILPYPPSSYCWPKDADIRAVSTGPPLWLGQWEGLARVKTGEVEHIFVLHHLLASAPLLDCKQWPHLLPVSASLPFPASTLLWLLSTLSTLALSLPQGQSVMTRQLLLVPLCFRIAYCFLNNSSCIVPSLKLSLISTSLCCQDPYKVYIIDSLVRMLSDK